MTQGSSQEPASLAELCQEAVERFGDDWVRVQAYVAERVARMPEDARKAFDADMWRILGLCAPERRNLMH